jgi:cardiolipin synthase A/B
VVRTSQIQRRASDVALPARALADQAFSRAAGAPLIEGNSIRLLRNGAENYPAWLHAIAAARRHVHLEIYFICADPVGASFADALLASAARGVQVRVVYDWLGNVGRASRAFWSRLRSAGVEVRCYNPPSWDAPFGWLSRDHRKVLAVDGEVAFITGLCVGQMWLSDGVRQLDPWRDTGVEVRGPAVADVERAFARTWLLLGPALPPAAEIHPIAPAGDVRIRIVASEPAIAGMLRLDQLVATLARERVWLTDAYYAGTTEYVQTLRAAARQGVDVRLLLPGASDIPLLRALSRAGYRLLLEAGIRVFEWNGAMLHAKTAVVDGRWARVGSTNLNIASWFGNCELDAVVEDQAFAQDMEQMYLHDLGNATEIVLDTKQRVRAPAVRVERLQRRGKRGSAGRAAAGAVRIGNVLGAAFTARRVLGPIEARIMTAAGCVLLAGAVLFAWFPRLLAYPLALIGAWIAATLLYRGYRLQRARRNPHAPESIEEPSLPSGKQQ